MKILIFLLLSMAAGRCADPPILGPFSSASNIPRDLYGDPDMRPSTWGVAGADEGKITFRPPEGYRVRILRVYGDVIAWPRGHVAPGKFAGVLWGLQTTAPEGSTRGDWLADNTMVYVQVGLSDHPVRAPIDFDVCPGGLLEPDNVLVSKLADWLNDTGLVIHIEPTFTLVYRYEKPGLRNPCPHDGQRGPWAAWIDRGAGVKGESDGKQGGK